MNDATEGLPLHTNKAVAVAKAKRSKSSKKKLELLKEGDTQAVIDALTEKQRRFCEEFLVDLNATQAVIRAGYDTEYPNRIGYQLLEDPVIRYTIDALRMERNKNTDITKDFVLQKIQALLRKAESDNNINAALRAAELLGRHLSLFVDRTEVSGPDGGEIEIRNKQVKEEADSFVELIDRTAKNRLKVVE